MLNIIKFLIIITLFQVKKIEGRTTNNNIRMMCIFLLEVSTKIH